MTHVHITLCQTAEDRAIRTQLVGNPYAKWGHMQRRMCEFSKGGPSQEAWEQTITFCRPLYRGKTPLRVRRSPRRNGSKMSNNCTIVTFSCWKFRIY